MSDLDDLSRGLALIRKHARKRADTGQVREAHAELMRAVDGLLDEFRTIYNPMGVRYWEIYNLDGTRSYTTTLIIADKDKTMWTFSRTAELAYHEYLSRQNIFDDPRDEL